MTLVYNYRAIERKWGFIKEKEEYHMDFPQDLLSDFGYDALRMYAYFVGSLTPDDKWDDYEMDGIFRFLGRFWKLICGHSESETEDSKEMLLLRNAMIRDVAGGMEKRKYHTAAAYIMEYTKKIGKEARKSGISKKTMETMVRLISFFAPCMAEELWEMLEHTESVDQAPYPSEEPLQEENFLCELPIQINGKIRGQMMLSKGASKEEAEEKARYVLGAKLDGTIKKVCFVPGKIISFEVKKAGD